MNAIKTLLAVSVLAAAGAANAAVIGTFDVVMSGGSSVASSTGTGTAVLDDLGTMTLTMNEEGTTPDAVDPETNEPIPNSGLDFLTTATEIFNGGYAGGTFTSNNTGSIAVHDCHDVAGHPPACGYVTFSPPAPATPFDSAFGSVTAAGGVLTQAFTSNGVQTTNAYTLSNFVAAPAVPVPAAAWLFGSGLLGLAGTARRRRAA